MNADKRKWVKEPLTARLRARIFLEYKGRGIDEDMRHAVQEAATGKRSLRDFTNGDGYRLLDHLKGRRIGAAGSTVDGATKTRNTQHAPRSDSIIEIATAEQLIFIRQYAQNELGWKLGWNANYTECSSISKIISGHTKGRKKEIRLLTKSEARSVIEALKKIKERKSS